MCSIYYQRLAIFKAFVNVEVASFSNFKAHLFETRDTIIIRTFRLDKIKILRNLLDDSSLKNVAYIDPFSKLCNQRTFTHTFCAANENYKWFSELIELGYKFVPLHEVFIVQFSDFVK